MIYKKYKRYTILIVEDDIDVANMMSNTLESKDLDILLSHKYEEAIRIIDNFTINLLIVDYNLSETKTGINVIEYLKKKNPNCPSIMVSAFLDEGVKEKSLEAGVNITLEKPFKHEELIIVTRNLLSLTDVYEDTETSRDIISALSRAVEARDTYTEGHSKRVAMISLKIFDALEIEDYDDRKALRTGCLLHDIGKIAVPDFILKSTNKLSPEERKVIEIHPLKGFEVCKTLKRLGKALRVVRHHHEKLDGTGYPDNLKEDDIPMIVRISTIADIFDALTSKRSYRNENTVEEAIQIMSTDFVDKKQIDVSLFDIFRRVVIPKGNILLGEDATDQYEV